jgi:hypothetical protein
VELEVTQEITEILDHEELREAQDHVGQKGIAVRDM